MLGPPPSLSQPQTGLYFDSGATHAAVTVDTEHTSLTAPPCHTSSHSIPYCPTSRGTRREILVLTCRKRFIFLCHLDDVSQSEDITVRPYRNFLTTNNKTLKIANVFCSKFIFAVKLPYTEQYRAHYMGTFKSDHKLLTVQ